MGDFGLYDADAEIWPYRHIRSIIEYPADGGQDYIDGGLDDDYLIGSEFADTIYGGGGSDDIIGGHNNNRFGMDEADTLYGQGGGDVILGDNGEILREVERVRGSFPWTTYDWKHYPAPFSTEKIREARFYAYNIDGMQGGDLIYGGPGNVSVFVTFALLLALILRFF